MKLLKRGSHFYLVKRVPERFLAVEKRRQVWIALRTDSLKEAQRRASDALRDLENHWLARLAGNQPSAHRFDALSALAAARGFPYLPAEKLASRSLEEILERVNAARENDTVTAAVLGEQKPLSYRLSDLIPLYLDLTAVEVKDKSRDQRRIWQNTLSRSMERLIKIVGNKPIDALCREDVLNFRAHWAQRTQEENLSAASANRELTAIGGVISRLHKLKGIGDPTLFRGLAFSSVKIRRPPYAQNYIRDMILPCLHQGFLNQDATAITKILINIAN